MPDLNNRRPLASRQTGWAQRVTRALAATSLTPNQISMAGIVAAAGAGLCFWAAGGAVGAGRGALFAAGALLCQLRLMCNLFDGMVAVEAGQSSPDGGFWNEFPDRVSDLFILLGVGVGLGLPALGWAAAGFAFLTAYVRELGINCGAGADFAGPMAKQHRMALITAAAAVSMIEPLWQGRGEVMRAALWVVAAGTALTVLRRAWRLVRTLRASRV